MPASLTTEDRVEILTKNSSYVANALTHAWVGQLFRTLWRHEPTTKLHVFHAEVDDAGTDVVLIFGSVTRHVQLKSAHHRSTTGEVPVNAALADSVGGCVVWVRYDVQSLAITGQSFAGAKPGEFWSELRAFSVARRTTRNGARERPLRPNVRKVPKKAFEPLPNYAVLAGRLFGVEVVATKEDGYALDA